MTPLISVVIPTRRHELVTVTLDSLMQQTCQDLEVHVVVDHDGRGAPWARNQGARRAAGRYLLFSDSDIAWVPTALEDMLAALRAANPDDGIVVDDDRLAVGYAYGAYRMGGSVYCLQPWDLKRLYGGNYISTMSLIDRRVTSGSRYGRDEPAEWFDESLSRLQDWDLWLSLACIGVKGVDVPRVLFETAVRDGLSFGVGALGWDAAFRAVRRKHRLE